MTRGASAFVCGITADGERRSYRSLATPDGDAFLDVIEGLESLRA